MEGVERTNVVMVHPNKQTELAPYNLYIIEIDKRNRNCYNCRGFRHLSRNCRNRRIGNRIGEERRLEYRENGNNIQRRIIKEGNGQNNNLNRDRDLIVLN